MKPVRFDVSPPPDLSLVPRHPGVYMFRDREGEILYVGKARDLRRRLSSYVSTGARPWGKAAVMLKRASTFEYILTDTEKEALILEAVLIKENAPRYNTRLRDDKAYPFLCIETDREFPRIGIKRRRSPGGDYFGPYPSAGSAREALRFVAATFGLRTCKDSSMRNRDRACIRYQMHRCSAPCTGAISKGDYMQRVEEARLFLMGRAGSLLSRLRQEMERAAGNLEFERAAGLRDRIRAVQNVLEGQEILYAGKGAWDVVALHRQGMRAVASVTRVREGTVIGQGTYRLDTQVEEADPAVMSIFLRHYYMSAPIPGKVLVSVEPEEGDLLAQWMSELAHRRVKIDVPRRGRKHRLLCMGIESARKVLENPDALDEAWEATRPLLREILGRESDIRRVECVDISTIQGEASVGSIVCFLDGRPWKKGYRHYNVRTVSGVDDYGMMREVLRRRLASAGKGGGLPDLIVVDGGPGQLGVATRVVDEAGLSTRLSLASIAKDASGEGEKIYLPGRKRPLVFQRHHPVLLFFQRVRDEAHRFGITFHRKKRGKAGLRTVLAGIPGVGAKREQALLLHFGSLSRVRGASVEEIARVRGIPRTLAETIHRYLHGQGA